MAGVIIKQSAFRNLQFRGNLFPCQTVGKELGGVHNPTKNFIRDRLSVGMLGVLVIFRSVKNEFYIFLPHSPEINISRLLALFIGDPSV